MDERGDYLYTIEKRDGVYRALVFQRMGGGSMDTVARSNFFATQEQAQKEAARIIDRAMLARDYD